MHTEHTHHSSQVDSSVSRRQLLATAATAFSALLLPSCSRSESHANKSLTPAELLLSGQLPFPDGVQASQAIKSKAPLATIVTISVPRTDDILYRGESIGDEALGQILAAEPYLSALGDVLSVLQRRCQVHEVWVPGYTRLAESPENSLEAAAQFRYRADFIVAALRQRFGEGLRLRGADDQTLWDAFCFAQAAGNAPNTISALQGERDKLLLTWLVESRPPAGALVVCLRQVGDGFVDSAQRWNGDPRNIASQFDLIELTLPANR